MEQQAITLQDQLIEKQEMLLLTMQADAESINFLAAIGSSKSLKF
jgi:hypothetical protein